MKLDSKEFKEYKSLLAKAKENKLTASEKARLEELESKKKVVKDSKFKPGNDFSWWNKYPVLLNGSANLPFNWFPGTSLLKGDNTGTREAPVGALRVALQNTYGTEDSHTGPINMTARNLYLAMHRKYRGISSYESADLGMVLIATVELLTFIARLERIYGVINRYSVLNRNTPDMILHALDVPQVLADNIRANLNDFRTGLNMRIMRAQNIVMPKDLSIIADKLALYGYVYKDHDDRKAQYIVFDTTQAGMYDATTISTGGAVNFIGMSWSAFTTYDQLLGALDRLITALVEDSDVIRIYADMLAYLGEEKLLHILPLPEDYVINPEYSESILHKFHNLTMPGYLLNKTVSNQWSKYDDQIIYKYTCPATVQSMTDWDTSNFLIQHDGIICTRMVLQDTGGNMTTSTFSVNGVSYYIYNDSSQKPLAGTVNYFYDDESVSILDTYQAEPNIETVTEGVLWKSGIRATSRSAPSRGYVVETCALEVCVGLHSYGYDNINQTNYGSELYLNISDCGQDVNEPYSAFKANYSMPLTATVTEIGQFDWAPLVYIWYQTAGSGGVSINQFDSNTVNTMSCFPVMGDINNARVVRIADLAPIHTAICYSAFTTDAAVIGAEDKVNSNKS